MDEMKVIVLGAKQYKFTNRETGEILQGTNVFYIDPTQAQDEKTKGFEPSKANLPYEYFDNFKGEFPQEHDIQMQFVLAGRKPTIKVKGFSFKKPLKWV